MMIKSRRLVLITGAAGIAGTLACGADVLQTPQYRASPNAPTNPNAPAGMNGPEIIHPNKDALPNISQTQIVGMVHQLFKLSAELQDEVDHTDMKATFPLTVVKKAQQIEKLARQIKEHAKG
jgi:hypothetical protein